MERDLGDGGLVLLLRASHLFHLFGMLLLHLDDGHQEPGVDEKK